MLKRVIKDHTNVMGKPVDWNDHTDKPCDQLHVRAVPTDGTVVFQSAWEPTPDELALLNAGGSIILHCWGAQIPVALTVDAQG